MTDSASRGWWVLAASLAPALAAVWAVPFFVTQDGPAHLYNAQILDWSFDPNSPFRDVFTIKWQPIPNWAGHLLLAGLVALLPAWVADRIMTSVTLVGFAVSVLWMRSRVAGSRGMAVAALLAGLLAMNLSWLFGFASFMLGACLFAVTLGFWWASRDHLSAGRVAALMGLLVLGYFCHVVSLGLTVIGLLVLALASPISDVSASPWRQRFHRAARTCVCFIPLGVLGAFYIHLSRQGGPMHPCWENLSDPWSPAAWGERAGWVDPLTLAVKDGIPFTSRAGTPFILFSPVVWLALALLLWWYVRITPGPGALVPRCAEPSGGGGATSHSLPARCDSRAGWLLLAGLLVVAAIAGPDSFGPAHGEFLPQRVALLGLAALVPAFDVDASRWAGRASIGAITLALALQSVIVWDYALYSDRSAGQIVRALPAVGTGQRIATLLVATRSRFRVNPLLHAENWLGVDTGNVVWNNYETTHYYFPVQFRTGIDRPGAGELEWTSIQDDPKKAASRIQSWNGILEHHARSIDVVLVWKSDPQLDAITARYFDRVDRRGDVRIFRKGDEAAAAGEEIRASLVTPRDGAASR